MGVEARDSFIQIRKIVKAPEWEQPDMKLEKYF